MSSHRLVVNSPSRFSVLSAVRQVSAPAVILERARPLLSKMALLCHDFVREVVEFRRGVRVRNEGRGEVKEKDGHELDRGAWEERGTR